MVAGLRTNYVMPTLFKDSIHVRLSTYVGFWPHLYLHVCVCVAVYIMKYAYVYDREGEGGCGIVGWKVM